MTSFKNKLRPQDTTSNLKLTFNTKISPVALLISKLLSDGFSALMPGPVKK